MLRVFTGVTSSYYLLRLYLDDRSPPPQRRTSLGSPPACGVLIYWERPRWSYWSISSDHWGTGKCDTQRAVSNCKWGLLLEYLPWASLPWHQVPKKPVERPQEEVPVNSSSLLSASLWMTPVQSGTQQSSPSGFNDSHSPQSPSWVHVESRHPTHHWSGRYNRVLLLKLLSFGVVCYNSTN